MHTSFIFYAALYTAAIDFFHDIWYNIYVNDDILSEVVMIQYHIFPGGLRRVVTFSYDDGSENDRRLIGLFNKYSVKGTFHLNGIRYLGISDEARGKLCEQYSGHEISCHTLQHGWPARMPEQSLVREITEERRILEDICSYPVVGMSYPSGSFNERVCQVARNCGILYSRTTKSTKGFILPDDFMQWHPSCHHRDALSLCEPFLASLDSEWTHPLFYIWGHSHELRCEEDWEYMEQILKKLSGNPKIWYATNIEIYRYIEAQRRLEVSYDESVFYNPSSLDVWVERNKRDIICIPAGQTVRVP